MLVHFEKNPGMGISKYPRRFAMSINDINEASELKISVHATCKG